MLLALAQSVSFAGSVANAWPSDSWQAQYADLHRSILNVGHFHRSILNDLHRSILNLAHSVFVAHSVYLAHSVFVVACRNPAPLGLY